MTTLEQRLAAVDACAVSDALDSLKLPGVAYGLQRLTTTTRVVGRVIPVQLVEAGRNQPSGKHLCTAAVEASGPGTVIVVDNGGRTRVSGWGGNLSLAASRAGCAGVIIDGACRDLDESAEFGFPVFAANPVPTTARGRIIEQAWNVPIQIQGVTVRPGDWVVADGSGVVFIPAERVEEVLQAAEVIVDKERQMAARIRDGVPISEVMGASYEFMLNREEAE
ncbi:RraA family protein [Granulicoccus phenolivorans]|uniref:RraA family protein n=1 Tax=Granulicoccus phenolivorans TaxID=266854 RepID=UPI000420CD65|nr:hypothetical protein [Granulicoccus phenolivorans]